MRRYHHVGSVAFAAGIAALFGLWSAGRADEDHDAKGKEVTLKGEIVDLQCFMSHPDNGQGKDHAKCAESCMAKGLPIGFLSGDQVYLLLSPGHDSVKDLVKGMAGKEVTLAGDLIEHHGLKSVRIESIDGVKAEGADHHK